MLNPIRHLPSEITRTNRRYLNFPMENRVEFRASKFRDTSKAKEQEGAGYRKIPDLFIYIYIRCRPSVVASGEIWSVLLKFRGTEITPSCYEVVLGPCTPCAQGINARISAFVHTTSGANTRTRNTVLNRAK